jgi:DNA-directed RNA polymerase specialized sigma24 family protein
MDRLPHHIVEAASQLDERACAELLSRCEGLVRAAIRQGGYYCVADGDEEDLRAELRYQILRSLPRWEPEKGPFSTWVYGIARNRSKVSNSMPNRS